MLTAGNADVNAAAAEVDAVDAAAKAGGAVDADDSAEDEAEAGVATAAKSEVGVAAATVRQYHRFWSAVQSRSSRKASAAGQVQSTLVGEVGAE